MKLKTLLVLGASTLMSISASAWEKPVPQTQDIIMDGETAQYLYNVGAGKFLVGANDWSTRASVGDNGYQWKVTQSSDASAETTTYTLYDHVEKGNDGKDKGWLAMFCDNNASIWVDNLTGANVNSWTLTAVDNGKYKIGNQALPGEYLGAGVAGTDTRLYMTSYFETQGLDAYYEWTGVSVDEYNAYLQKISIYLAADSLNNRIADVKAKYEGIDLSSAEAVYANESSTLSQLRAAYTSIDAAISKYSQEHASVANPIDMSAMIVNGTFDTNGNFTGWSGSGFGAGGTTSTCAERYQMTFDTYQDISNIPNGIYKVNVDGFHRAGSTEADYTAEKAGTATPAYVYGINMAEAGKDTTQANIMHLFHAIPAGAHVDDEGNDLAGLEYDATEDGETVAYYVPNSMLDFTNYNGTTKSVSEPFYKTNSVVVPVSEGKIRLGVKCTSSATYSWTIVDNFGLTYYGNGADAWTELMNDYAKNCALDESAIISTSIREAYNSAVSGAVATDYTSYKSAVAAINAAKANADVNSAAWADYQALIDKCQLIVDDQTYSSLPQEWKLAKGVSDAKKNVNNPTLTTDQIVAAIATLQELYDDVKSATPAGTDVSNLLVNTEFADGWTGWSHTGTGGNVQTNTSAKCAEAWNSANFDIHQDVENAPAGMYEISLQGFYRYVGGNDAGWLEYFNSDGTVRTDEDVASVIKDTPAKIFLNDNQTSLSNIWQHNVESSYATENWGSGFYTDPLGEYSYPDNMTTAGKMFDMGYYKVSAAGAVANKGDKLSIGVKGSTDLNYGWAIFTRFKLVYQGYRMKYIAPEVAKQVEYLSELSSPMGSDVKAEADELLETLSAIDTETAYTDADESEENFKSLCTAYSLKNKIDTSIALFSTLSDENTALEEALGTYSETASQEALAAAGELNGEIAGAIEGGDYTDADATAKIEEIKKMIKALAVPANVNEASFENPIDMTGFITNPSFETGDVTGWTNDGAESFAAQGNTAFAKTDTYYAERWHANGSLDLNQTITDLPEGTYKITCDSHASNTGELYANDESVAINNTADSSTGVSGNAVYVYIKDGEALKIGVRGTLTSSTWFCVDNFKLSCVAYKQDTEMENVIKVITGASNGDEETAGEGFKVNVVNLNKAINRMINNK